MASNRELSTKEQAEQFYKNFQNEIKVINAQLDEVLAMPAEGRDRARKDELLKLSERDFERLHKDVQDASVYVTAHDQRMFTAALKSLGDKLRRAYNPTPKPKFAFKSASLKKTSTSTTSRASTSTTSSEASTPKNKFPPKQPISKEAVVSDEDGPYDVAMRKDTGTRPRTPSFSHAQSVYFNKHENMHIILPATAIGAMTTGKVKHIQRCIIDMSNPKFKHGGALSSLQIKDIDESLIITHEIAGPIHITNMTNSVLVTSCRQFRLHECRNVDVYLQSASRPIIENSTGIRFAPMPSSYASNLRTLEKDQWNQVDDFQWHKQEPSPNWVIMPESERVGEKVWTEVVPATGNANVGREDILKTVGVVWGKVFL